MVLVINIRPVVRGRRRSAFQNCGIHRRIGTQESHKFRLIGFCHSSGEFDSMKTDPWGNPFIKPVRGLK